MAADKTGEAGSPPYGSGSTARGGSRSCVSRSPPIAGCVFIGNLDDAFTLADLPGCWIDTVHDRWQPMAMTFDMDSCIESSTGLEHPVYGAPSAADRQNIVISRVISV